MSTVYILPNLRKGLSTRISGSDDLRATFDVNVQMKGHRAGEEGDELTVVPGEEGKQSSLSRSFVLAGPVDVRGVNKDAVSLLVPADKSSGFSNDYMPYIEFHEEDLPWKYTPLKSSGTLQPWLLLLACKDGEFKVESDAHGNRRVSIDLDGAADDPTTKTFFPAAAEFHKLAHVQVTVTDEDCQDVVAYVKDHPDDGISRLFCYRELSRRTRYTMFLVPAFELGRLAGLGEPVSGSVGVETLSWSPDTRKTVFPVYYQWSFTTGSDSFMKLARRQVFLTGAEMAELPAGLKADISETGLRRYRIEHPEVDDTQPIDIPSALVKTVKTKGGDRKEDAAMDEELKNDLLKKSPVFSDDDPEHPVYEDPWVVPPVYGARHVLATPMHLENSGFFLKELNLRFGNRAVAGMGAKVVKRNQEQFMNRAWGMVEEVNALNQRVREFYQVLKTNGAADAKVTALRNYEFPTKVFGLQADAAIRIANAQSAADINAVDLANDITGKNLNAMYSAMGDYVQGTGVSLKELFEVMDEKNWAVAKKEEIVKQGYYYQYYTGRFPFFSEVEERFRFLGGSEFSLDVVLPEIKFETFLNRAVQDGARSDVRIKVIAPIFSTDPFLFRNRRFASSVSILKEDENVRLYGDSYRLFEWMEERAYFAAPRSVLYLDSLNHVLERAQFEFEKKWRTYSETDISSSLFLPVQALFKPYSGQASDYYPVLSDLRIPARGLFMKQEAYDKWFPGQEYANGIAFPVETGNGEAKFVVFPAKKLYDNPDAKYFYFYRRVDNREAGSIPLVSTPETDCFDVKCAQAVSGSFADGPVYVKNVAPGMILANDKVKLVLKAQFCLNSYKEKGVDTAGCNAVWDSRPYGGLGVLPLTREGHLNRFFLLPDPAGDRMTLICQNEFHGHDTQFIPNLPQKYMELKFANDGFFKTENGVATISIKKLCEFFDNCVNNLETAAKYLWRPNAVFFSSVPSNLKKISASTVLGVKNIDSMVENMESIYWKVIEQVNLLRDTLQEEVEEIGERNRKDEENLKDLKETDIKQAGLVDADENNRKRLVTIAKELSSRKMSMDLMESNFDGKYPVMAAPIFPDPTSFYLRELSEKYILPAVDELKMNSISCFVTNPAFEEAFLAGMNTEMGRELLWREYPTDERGTCFRKFWDQDVLPDDFGKGYFDIKYMHNWKGPLGGNHEEGKGKMTVFVIKSELMCQYPQTAVCLATVKTGKGGAKTLEPALYPSMTGWLSDDTYMAGFHPEQLHSTSGIYLAFFETDKSQRFTRIRIADEGKVPDTHSSEFAVNRRNDGSVWGRGVNPDDLNHK